MMCLRLYGLGRGSDHWDLDLVFFLLINLQINFHLDVQLTVYILIIIFFLPKNLEILKKDDPKNRLYINQLFCY